jgi:DNA-binding transcriptional regulator YhcF (GntR family)
MSTKFQRRTDRRPTGKTRPRSQRFTEKGTRTTQPRDQMSAERALRWLWFLEELEFTDSCNKTAKRLMWFHRKHNETYPTQKNMADALLVHRNTIGTHTRRLEKAGLLSIIRTDPEYDTETGKFTRRRSNRYLPTFPTTADRQNRRQQRRRRKAGIETTVVAVEDITPQLEAVLESAAYAEVFAEVDTISPVHTYEQPNGPEDLPGLQKKSAPEVSDALFVEKTVDSNEITVEVNETEERENLWALRESLRAKPSWKRG